MIPRSKIPLKLRNFVKSSVLTMFMYTKDVFPKSFTWFLSSRLFGIEMRTEDDVRQRGVTLCRFKNGAQGALCVSIDFDLPFKRFENIDRIFDQATLGILGLSSRYLIPFSWGICGKTAVCRPKIFQQIIHSNIKHDVGAHTFSHMDLSDPAYSDVEVSTDIRKGIEVLKEVGRPVSFIFPWNREGHLATLRKLGFITYRGNKQAEIGCPTRKEELWDIHQTYYLYRKTIAEIAVLLRLLDLAIAYGNVFHVWSHPWNMHVNGNVDEFMEKVLIPFFEHTAKRRKEKSLWICTMRELANYSEARRKCQIVTIIRKRNEIELTVRCQIDSSKYDFPPKVTLRIPLPKRSCLFKVAINKKEAYENKDWYIAETRNKKYLYLTLQFEKPIRQVLIQTKNSNIYPNLEIQPS